MDPSPSWLAAVQLHLLELPRPRLSRATRLRGQLKPIRRGPITVSSMGVEPVELYTALADRESAGLGLSGLWR